MTLAFPPRRERLGAVPGRVARTVLGLLARSAFGCGLFFATHALRAEAALLESSEILARAPQLPLEDRRYLVYLYARLNQADVAQALAEQILRENPTDRQTLLVLASLAVERKDATTTLRLAREFLRHYPGDHQGLYFLGAGHYLARQFADANHVLRTVKREQFAHRRYPYETDLAASAYAAGDWYRAMLSYQELLRHHNLSEELRSEVREVLDGLYRAHLPRSELGAYHTQLDRSAVWRYVAQHSRHLSDRTRLGVSYTRDAVSLEAAPGLRAFRAARAEVAANLATLQLARWRTDSWLGASGEGLIYGARVHYQFARQREISLGWSGGERALDSLALEALDGRQDRLDLTASWQIEADLTLFARGYWRSLSLGGQRLGDGGGIEMNLDHTVWRQGPQVVVGYRGALARFTPAAPSPALAAPLADPATDDAGRLALLNNLVARRINRHGVGVVVADNLADAWRYRLNVGTDYDFELATLNWNALLAVTFLPRKSLELTAEAGYTTSASASNAGSAASLFNFYLRYHH